MPSVITADGKYIYMLGHRANIYVYSTAGEKLIKTIPIPPEINPEGIAITPDPEGIAITPDGKHVVVVATLFAPLPDYGGYAYVIDTQTQTIVPATNYHISKSVFHDVAITPDGQDALIYTVYPFSDTYHGGIIKMNISTYKQDGNLIVAVTALVRAG